MLVENAEITTKNLLENWIVSWVSRFHVQIVEQNGWTQRRRIEAERKDLAGSKNLYIWSANFDRRYIL